MSASLTVSLIWWITVVELPALAGLFWLIWRNRRDSDHALHSMRHRLETAAIDAKEQLAGFKLEVAKSYASIAYLKDVEERLTAHLLRIEGKLDIRPEEPNKR